MDIIGKRYWYFLLSALVVVPGLVFLALFGLPLSIDFTSGSLLELTYGAGTRPQPEAVAAYLGERGLENVYVRSANRPSGEELLLIRTLPIDEDEKANIEQGLQERFGSFTKSDFTKVAALVATETTQRAILAVLAAAICILLYISLAFRSVPNPLRFGTCAVIAMFHDIAVVVGIAAILGKLSGWEADPLFLTALLTVIGFSVHDTIVVFDRIRENTRRRAGEPLESIVNHSIIQTLDRSINTQLTVLFTLTALILFGGVTIRHFVSILLIGIISGTYSSVFNASPLLVEWERRPQRLLYALSFVFPPLGLIIGLYNIFREGEKAKNIGRNSIIATVLGVIFIGVLVALRIFVV